MMNTVKERCIKQLFGTGILVKAKKANQCAVSPQSRSYFLLYRPSGLFQEA